MRQSGLKVPGVLLGVGLGGFVDGILLHQILQWHHMVSNVVPPTTLGGLKVNTTADGLFHALTWVFVLTGLALLWRVVRRCSAAWSTSAFIGWMLVGWGGFNIVEGLVDHQILQVHHVRPGPHQAAYDLGFLLFGALLLWAGRVLAGRRSG